MLWLRMFFNHKIKVYVQVDESGNPLVERGLVTYKYQIKAKETYNTRPSKLTLIPGQTPQSAPSQPELQKTEDLKIPKPQKPADLSHGASIYDLEFPELETLPDSGSIIIYTDGGASPNPGATSAGVVLLYGKHVLEYWEYMGQGTNNIGELTAILRALELVSDPSKPVHLYSDSNYAIGVCSGSMKAKQNRELIATIQEQMQRFSDLQLHKVKAHVGIALNEHVDNLVDLARRTRASGKRRSTLK